MSAGLFAFGVVILLGSGFLPESEARIGVGVLGLGFILAASLLRERTP